LKPKIKHQSPSVVIIDNYDSFTHNLQHYVKTYTDKCTVVRNDKTNLKFIGEFDKILLSPGPGRPENAGITNEVIKRFHDQKPILGVCLGHQAIAEYFSAHLFNLTNVIHGKSTAVKITKSDSYLFKNIPKNFSAGRYHSWAVERKSITKTPLTITSETKDGVIMSLRHNLFDIQSVQFHPESIMTKYGKKMIQNWVEN